MSTPRLLVLAALFCLLVPLDAQQAAPPAAHSQLTLYNDDFAVARTNIPLDLHAGSNIVSTTAVTRQLEPDSVVLRDPSGRSTFQVAEQNYDAAVVSQEYLLHRFEGQEIDFEAGRHQDGSPQLIRGRILRAPEPNTNPYGNYQAGQPLIEVDGHMQFTLPGQPLFPASTDGLLLKPTLRWLIDAPRAAHLDAELAYITRGMQWQATYNVVLGEGGPAAVDAAAALTGWVTLENHSGTSFPDAAVKLMAGDVAKIQDLPISGRKMAYGMAVAQDVSVTPTEKPFDDFHLYDLHRVVTLLDGETKQVQFLDVPDITIRRTYSYDGASPGFINQPRPYMNQTFTDIVYGLGDNKKVAIEEEFANTKANHLGVPLPSGRLRLYRRDTDGQLEFTGEAIVPHTPADQPVHIPAGNAFDLTGSRTQTAFHVDNTARTMDETFTIHLTNAKADPTVIRVVEHLQRARNWTLTAHSAPYTAVDAHTIAFPVTTPAHGEADVTYTVHYSW